MVGDIPLELQADNPIWCASHEEQQTFSVYWRQQRASPSSTILRVLVEFECPALPRFFARHFCPVL